MSRMRDWFSGMRFFFSTIGERFADEQADTILSQIRSCLAIRHLYRDTQGHYPH